MSGIGAYRAFRNSIIAGALCLGISAPAVARNIDADYVLNEMNNDQRVSYLEGLVEGLAYARWLRDRPDETGFNCIYDWYDTDFPKKWDQMRTWLARHSDKPVSVLLHVMIKQECGE